MLRKELLSILIVEDEPLVRWSLETELGKEGYTVKVVESGEEALELINENNIDLVILDVGLPGISGIDVLENIRAEGRDLPVIIITAYEDVASAVTSMRLGAYDYITKPFQLENVKITVEKALERASLQKEVEQTRQRLKDEYGVSRIIGTSPAMQEVFEMVNLIARSDATTVLLSGESGTGKDLIAKAIHYQSQRYSKPFLDINCAAVPETLLESELMGHEKGAFTDAKTIKIGLLEKGSGGTIFLDEIGDAPLDIQVKLLRVIEERSFRRVGGVTPIKVDIRLIAATNQDLEFLVNERRFRADLYYRLKVFPIFLPPLRERGEDVLFLSKFFIDSFNREFKKQVPGMSPEVEELLMAYPWPGNVRELKNVIERAMILVRNGSIQPDHLPKELLRDADEEKVADDNWVRNIPPGLSLEQVEEAVIRNALEATDGNQLHAARRLNISRHTLRYRMKRFSLL